MRVTSWQHQANTRYRLTLKNSLRITVPGPRPGTGIGGPFPRPLPPTRPPHTPNLGTIVVRGIPYVDHSPYTNLSVKTVLLGDYFNINTQTLNFNNQGTLKVFIQDVNTPTGLGVTGFELKGVHQYGKSLQIQAPWLHLFKNRTFHVTVFQYTGQKNNYAQAGTITFK